MHKYIKKKKEEEFQSKPSADFKNGNYERFCLLTFMLLFDKKIKVKREKLRSKRIYVCKFALNILKEDNKYEVTWRN